MVKVLFFYHKRRSKMSYKLVIAEKPSVAQSIAKVIGADKREDGYLEGNGYIVSWCVGHLVELSSPEFYDEKYEKWRYEDLPILPSEWNYQIAEATRKQFGILKKLMEREDVTGLVEATDAGREGELISRLVYDQAKCKKPFERLWISSMEDQAISDGFSNLKNGREYDDLYRAALCRERADWIVGMNATRLFSTLYGQTLNVGRVMTPTLAMIVQREAEIDGFKPEPIYRLSISCGGITALSDRFEKKQDAENILNVLKEQKTAQVTKIDPADKQEKAPQLYSLTALQRDANRFLGFTAQQTLDYTQSLYEKKLVTYPRTDARVLSTAVAKEIGRNISGLKNFQPVAEFAQGAMESGTYKGIAKTKYVNDKQITDHYAIIPTGQGFGALRSLAPTALKVYEIICRRFLSIFYPAAEYQKVAMTLSKNGEKLFANFKYLINDGYLKVAANSFSKKKDDVKYSPEFISRLAKIKKGDKLSVQGIDIKEGETSPPKRYNSGSLILTMENAGQFIEDEALREQIKGAGIGTSATRDGIITKLEKNKYISLNKKTQIVNPTFLGEIIYDIVYYSINGLLRADLTASWEKGLEGVAEGQISKQEYTDKMTTFVTKYTNLVKQIQNQNGITGVFDKTKVFYAKGGGAQKKETRATARTGAKAEKNADTQ